MPAGCRSAQCARRFPAALGVLLVLAVLIAPVFTPTAGAASVERDGALPGPRVGAAAVAVGDGIHYVIGGRVDASRFSDEIIRYDANAGTAEVVAHLPAGAEHAAGRQAATAVWSGSKVYVFGGAVMTEVNVDGQRYSVPKSSADVIAFDPADNSVRKLDADPLPVSVWGATAEWVDGVAYVFGGFHFEVQRADAANQQRMIAKFDPSAPAGQRTVKLDRGLPYAAQDVASAFADGRVWLMGGLAKNGTRHPCPYYTSGDRTYQPDVCVSNKILTFDPRTERAREAWFTLPEARQFAGGVAVGDAVYVVGGRSAEGAALSGILRVDPRTEIVDALFPQLPGGRYAMGATVDGADVFLFGGRDSGQHQDGVSDVLRFHTGVTPPLAPRDLEVRMTEDGVRLTWEPPHYDGGSPVTEYRVYRADVAADGSVDVAAATRVGVTSGSTAFTDDDARPGGKYVYRVFAVNAAGASRTAAEGGEDVPARAPAAPSQARAYAGDGYVVLRWAPPADDGGSPVFQYSVYKGNASRPIAILERPDVLEYRDEDVENGVTYQYHVRAENSKGSGARSPFLVATPREVPNPPEPVRAKADGESVRVTWTNPAANAAGFIVYRGADPLDLTRVTEEPIPASAPEYVDEAVERGATYHYAVAAVTEAREEGPPSRVARVSLVDAPSAPRNLIATPEPAAVNLSWHAPAELGGATEVTYVVSRAGPDGNARVIASGIEGTRFVDARGLAPATTYTYTVRAFNGILGNESAPASAAPRDVVREPPVAQVTTVGPTRVDLNGDVTFDASASYSPEGRVVRWIYDFGDGSKPVVSPTPQVTHRFTREASFIVELVVEDDRGTRSDPARVTIDVGRAGMDEETPGTGRDAHPSGEEVERPGDKPPRLWIPAPGALAALAALGAACVAGARRRA